MFGSKKEIFEYIDTQRSTYPLKVLCQVYDVSRFGYPSWKIRGKSAHTRKDAELTASIEKVFSKVDGIYGSPKVHAQLKRESVVAGKNRIARLMRENGLKPRCARIYRCHAKMDRFYASINNQIKEVEATAPNQI